MFTRNDRTIEVDFISRHAHRCLIQKSLTGLCFCYVGVQRNNPLFGFRHYQSHFLLYTESGYTSPQNYINCNYPISYSSNCKDFKKFPISSELWWFGFLYDTSFYTSVLQDGINTDQASEQKENVIEMCILECELLSTELDKICFL